MSLPGTTISNPREKLRTLLALNAMQVALLSATAGTVFSARGSGSIVNIASVLGFASAPQIAPAIYSGSKAFVVMFTQSLAAELANTGVYVQCVLPAATRTEIWGKSGMVPEQVPGMIDAHELVDAALLGFDRKEIITIPALLDDKLWATYEQAREALIPPTLEGRLADRYRLLAAAE
jgi:short-subunit dehydrogenase